MATQKDRDPDEIVPVASDDDDAFDHDHAPPIDSSDAAIDPGESIQGKAPAASSNLDPLVADVRRVCTFDKDSVVRLVESRRPVDYTPVARMTEQDDFDVLNDKYVFWKFISRGTQGHVYYASIRTTSDGELPFAIKTFPRPFGEGLSLAAPDGRLFQPVHAPNPRASPKRTAWENVKREVGILSKLRGIRGVVQLYEVIDDPAHHTTYLVMEHAFNGHLRQSEELPETAEVRVARIAKYARMISETLMAVHAQDVVHRDIKPENIMVTDNGERLVLIDFGVAEITTTGNVWSSTRGTLPYLAPEVHHVPADGPRQDSPPDEAEVRPERQVDGRALDMWALGVTLLHLLNGDVREFQEAVNNAGGQTVASSSTAGSIVNVTKAVGKAVDGAVKHTEFWRDVVQSAIDRLDSCAKDVFGEVLANLLCLDPPSRWSAEKVHLHFSAKR